MKPANISNQRILTELKKLTKENLTDLKAGPLPDDLYTWHFTFQGPENT
jgi:ubiquitin-protein ligase